MTRSEVKTVNSKFDRPWTPGDVVSIPIANGDLAFAHVLAPPLFAFYDYKSAHLPSDVANITQNAVLFKLWVTKYARLDGAWKKVFHHEPSPTVALVPKFFRQDSISDRIYEYNDRLDNATPMTYEQALDLERAAVWEPDHVVERLDAYFAGEACEIVARLRPRKPRNP